MIRAREGPKIALEFLQKFHLDDVFFGGNEISERDFEVFRAESRRLRKQLVARSRRDDDEIGMAYFAAGSEAHARAVCCHASHACADGRAARCGGAVEQEAIEHFARVNHDRVAHVKACAMAIAGDQFGGADDSLGLAGIEQEGISRDGFVRQSTTAGFFPRETLVEDRDIEAVACEALAAKRSGGTSSDNGDVFHGLDL